MTIDAYIRAHWLAGATREECKLTLLLTPTGQRSYHPIDNALKVDAIYSEMEAAFRLAGIIAITKGKTK